jgi:hypothetical protein
MKMHTPPTQLRSSAVPAISSSPRQLLLAVHSRLLHAPSMQPAFSPQSLSVVQPPALQWPSTQVWPDAQGLLESHPGALPGVFVGSPPGLAQATASTLA